MPAKVLSIFAVGLASLTFLNFVLRYYTYLLLVMAAHKTGLEPSTVAGDIPLPRELYVPFLTFIPTVSPVLLRPWVLLTLGFIEELLVMVLPAMGLLYYLGQYLELRWGLREYLKFVIIAVVVTNILVYSHYAVLRVAGSTSVPPVIATSTATIVALLVAVKQRIAHHYLIFFRGNLRIKVTHVPFLTVVALLVASTFLGEFRAPLWLSIYGIATSWTYLRFFRTASNERESYLLPYSLRNRTDTPPPLAGASRAQATGSSIALEQNTSKGDRSELFALYTFFPAPLDLAVKTISKAVFDILVANNLLNPLDFTSYDDNGLKEDINPLQLKLFSLSALKGAGDVSAIPGAPTITTFWLWMGRSRSDTETDIKASMDKRRKLAIKELE